MRVFSDAARAGLPLDCLARLLSGGRLCQERAKATTSAMAELKAAYAHMGSRGVKGKLVLVN